MRNLISFYLLFLLFGCSEHTTNNEIISFETVLGKEHSNELTRIVDQFEKSLLGKFGDITIENAYELHLKEVYDSEVMQPATWLKSQLKRDSLFRAYSNSLVEEIWEKPDTAWIEDSYLYWSYSDSKNISSRKISKNESNPDSLISAINKLERFNSTGSFIRAIKEISEKNKVAKWYYDTKIAANEILPHITAQVLLNKRIKLDDYIVKRIILIETVIKTCSNNGEHS